MQNITNPDAPIKVDHKTSSNRIRSLVTVLVASVLSLNPSLPNTNVVNASPRPQDIGCTALGTVEVDFTDTVLAVEGLPRLLVASFSLFREENSTRSKSDHIFGNFYKKDDSGNVVTLVGGPYTDLANYMEYVITPTANGTSAYTVTASMNIMGTDCLIVDVNGNAEEAHLKKVTNTVYVPMVTSNSTGYTPSFTK